MATKTHPFGTKFQYDLDDTGAYTDLGDVISITPGNVKLGMVDETHLESTNQFKEKTTGWGDAGEAKVKVHLTKAQFNTLYGTLLGVTYYFKVLFPLIDSEATNSFWKFTGQVSGIDWDSIERGSDETLKVTFTIQVTGKPTWTSGS